MIDQDNHIQPNTPVLPLATGFAGVIVGATVTYFWQRRKWKQLQMTVDELRRRNEREHLKRVEDENQLTLDVTDVDPVVVGEEFVQKVIREPHHGTVLNPRGNPADIVVEDPVKINNIFAESPGEEWNYELELQSRNPEFPYIIHKDEFFGDEMGYTQSVLTYYIGDDILADEQDVPMYKYGEIVGQLRFGHGSDDKNVVYVRNEKLETEYEILQHPGYYQVEVRGLEIEHEYEAEELKHSRRPGRMPRE